MLGNLKWLILVLIFIPVSLFVLKILVLRLAIKKEKKFLVKIEKEFSDWLEKENIVPETFQNLDEKEKIKLFKDFAKSLDEIATIDYTLPNLKLKIPITIYRKLRKRK